MADYYFWQGLYKATRGGLLAAVFWCCLPALNAQAQAPAWTLATSVLYPQALSSGRPTGLAMDASGNVLVTGNFSGKIAFGSTTLTSQGDNDIFLAKYLPATNTWAWAVSIGGTSGDYGQSVAVSGNNIYITAFIFNNAANAFNVVVGGAATPSGTTPQAGVASTTLSQDVLLAKYIDNGTSATLGWTQVLGGSGDEAAGNVVASGNLVYVTGTIRNNSTNSNDVLFGGSGTTRGTIAQYGASATTSQDIFLAKYFDNGSSATVAWTQVAGGAGADTGSWLAVAGNQVYITGSISNNRANTNGVVFGGAGSTAGTLPQYGASTTTSSDLILAKYLDNGSTATVAWTQVAGGKESDGGTSIAVSGPTVYVAGGIQNDLANTAQVVFGGAGTTTGSSPQYGASTNGVWGCALVAKYTDLGTSAAFGWSHIGGGNSGAAALAMAASGNQVYTTGYFVNTLNNANQMLFGGTGTTPGTIPRPGITATAGYDLLVAQYTDNGATGSLDWTQAGGSTTGDLGYALAVGNTRLYIGGGTGTPATFSNLTVTHTPSQDGFFLGAIPVTTALASTSAAANPTPRLYPNPAAGPASLQGATPGTSVLILDALGRRVATATADARGAAALPAGLAPGLYLVRAGASTVRWVVE